jgi:hypothetical protein
VKHWAVKVDANQAELVGKLRDMGVSAVLTHRVGGGFPDVACGWKAPCEHCGHRAPRTFLLEIKQAPFTLKNGELSRAAVRLTPDEEKFHREFQGGVTVVRDLEDVLRVIGFAKGGK